MGFWWFLYSSETEKEWPSSHFRHRLIPHLRAIRLVVISPSLGFVRFGASLESAFCSVMETELSMTSSVSGGGVTLENVKRKLDETMDEPVMAKKLKTKLSSISLDVGQTDDDDDDDDNGDDEDDDDGDGDDDDDGSGGDRTDDGDDNVSLTSNNSNEIASDTRSKDHMVEAVRGTATATTSTKVSMAANAATAATTSDFMLAERSDQIECPMYGQIVNRREFRRAGPYLIGLKLGHSPVDSIVQYLAKKGNEFFQLKILVLNNNTSNEKLLKDERQGKMLLHQEYSLLSLLEHQDGVMQQHGLFSVSVNVCGCGHVDAGF